MLIILWEFTVREEHLQEFIRACGSHRAWANLFSRADGYLGTELLRSSTQPNLFLTIDRWESAASFEIFHERFGREYNELDARFAGHTTSEKRLRVFSETAE